MCPFPWCAEESLSISFCKKNLGNKVNSLSNTDFLVAYVFLFGSAAKVLGFACKKSTFWGKFCQIQVMLRVYGYAQQKNIS